MLNMIDFGILEHVSGTFAEIVIAYKTGEGDWVIGRLGDWKILLVTII